MKLKLTPLLAVIGFMLSACTTTAETGHPPTTPVASTTTTAIVGGQIGPSQSGVKVDGQPVSITLSQFIDPARDEGGYTIDSQGASPQSDDHFATAELQITNRGNSTTSNAALSIVAYDQNGNVYSSVSNDGNISNQAYENFPCAAGRNLDGNANVSSLSPNEVFTYCLAFILPERDVVSKIEVSGIVGNGTGYNTWTIADHFSGWTSNSVPTTTVTPATTTAPVASTAPVIRMACQKFPDVKYWSCLFRDLHLPGLNPIGYGRPALTSNVTLPVFPPLLRSPGQSTEQRLP